MNSIVHPFLGQSVEVFKLSPGQNLGGPGLILDQNQLISVTKYKINTIISQVTVDFKHLKAFKRRNYPLGTCAASYRDFSSLDISKFIPRNL